MHTVELLEEAIQLAERLGFQIRQEWLDGAGGGCEIKGRRWLFIDLSLAPLEQLDQVLSAIRPLLHAEVPISPQLRRHAA